MRAGLRMWDARDQPDALPDALQDLVGYAVAEILPHLESDEQWLLEAQGCPSGGLLAEAMRAESRTMAGAVHELTTAADACEAMALTRVLHALLAVHDHHENLLRAAATS